MGKRGIRQWGSTEREDWIWRTFTGQCENLVHWKLPGIFEYNPGENF